MLKVLICDDEALIRASIKAMLLEFPFLIEIVGEAKNGEEAVHLIDTFSPDLILIDIRMPKKDGLTVIQEMKPHHPNSYFVILSGFSEFEYARDALSFGAFEYLLKPSSPSDLENLVVKITNHKRQHMETIRKQFHQDFLAYYNSASTSHYDLYTLSKLSFSCLVYTLDSAFQPAGIMPYEPLEEYLLSQMDTHTSLTYFEPSSGIMAIIIGHHAVPSESPNLENSCMHWITSHYKNFKITSLVSSEFLSAQTLKDFLVSSVNFIKCRSLLGIGKKYSVLDLKPLLSYPNLIAFGHNLHKLIRAYHNKDLLLVEKYLSRCTSKESLALIKTYPKIHKPMEMFFETTLMISLDVSLNNWQETLITTIETTLGSCVKTNRSVECIKEYVYAHYMDDISIHAIATTLDVTPNYLSALFHKTTGTKFIQFLKQVRIEQAKLLLVSTEEPIKNIAIAVGYYSQRHFTKVFTEIVGMYPSDYRRELD